MKLRCVGLLGVYFLVPRSPVVQASCPSVDLVSLGVAERVIGVWRVALCTGGPLECVLSVGQMFLENVP